MAMEGPVAYRRLDPFGVELDLDLARPLSDAQESALQRLYQRETLLLLRGQLLGLERQTQIMRLFGDPVMGSNENGYHSTDPATGSGGTIELEFHQDYEYTGLGLTGLSLLATDLVSGTSNTLFASSRLALADMPADLRRRIDAAQVELCCGLDAEILMVEPEAKPLRNVFPVIRPHPVTGEGYVCASEFQTVRLFCDGPEEELRRALFAHLYDRAHVYNHVWTVNDLVIWDNRILQHARGNLVQSGVRTLQRAAIGFHTLAELDPLIRQAWPKFAWLGRADAEQRRAAGQPVR